MVVTNHMLKKKWAEVNNELREFHHSKNNTTALDDEGSVIIYEDTIEKVQGDYMINSHDVKAKLFSPMPCLYWKCLGTPDKNGIINLNKKLSGLFLDDGVNVYCIGVSGASDEFEVRLQVGMDEIRLNNLFLNVNTQHLVVNGLEEKRT